MKMDSCNLDRFEKICTHLAQALPDNYNWQWEERFGVALVVFDRIDMEEIRSIAGNQFDQQWDAKSVTEAPDHINAIIGSLFGISPGQVLFSSDERTGAVLYAAWWPWGNGVNISLRVGIFQQTDEKCPAETIHQHLKQWFAI